VGRDGCTVATLARNNTDPPRYTYEGNSVGVLVPPSMNPRLWAQASVFTIHKDPIAALQSDHRILIAKRHRMKIREELAFLGVSDHTIFPDLDGIAKHVVVECGFWA